MKRPRIEIDSDSGFCFGVTRAISKAEEELRRNRQLYCLGDIVHNSDEVERLRRQGLVTISHEQMAELRNVTVLLRAHGEPPSTYELARRNNIEIIDATCPVVLKLQQRIKEAYDSPECPQIVIYGKPGHAEVNGLLGQTNGDAKVVESEDDLAKVAPDRPTRLYSQTTKSVDGLRHMELALEQRMNPGVEFRSFDTICRSVANRVDKLRDFARSHDVIIFVAGRKSSNGRFLYETCRAENPRTLFISEANELPADLGGEIDSIGICGATSTPRWLMEQVRDIIEQSIES
ncbi:MAG: 4-hydroxy-3-methylbut-2-enyl diphosphate reductase [Bacteroides sp.]|nr:4-hydroxy-3-methylbut-2-enyl diphosphate reductase [Bacteroides sp.]MCM1379227.1 4-hydroxy-3-methylbut-2-enyl diphosphate reductase [Bacteroides sp.]MCM1445115.1 4-hydroxy-3-methylbut-2-enyl diphosphate reductase [Prevotella sp.]